MNRTLCMRGLDYDLFPDHNILGKTLIPIMEFDINQGEIDEWRILVPGYDETKPD